MVEAGNRLDWGRAPIADKHCVGGLPGNRTTPIVVAILASLGITIPKTSSRAITSPAGTADTMEVLAPVNLDLTAIRRVVEREGVCVVWGGAVRLSPLDDVLIRIERALDLDAEGQLVASIISKKVAAGSTHLVLDVPVGPTAKVRSPTAARSLSDRLTAVVKAFELEARIVTTDGSQPVGRGIGPALEARDVLAVLRQEADAPEDLTERALFLAGVLVELAGAARAGKGRMAAEAALADGRARAKLEAICEAQGGMREPPLARWTRGLAAPRPGRVAAIDNRRIALLAKLAGAPDAKAAGVELHVRVGMAVQVGMPLFTVHAESSGELDYALHFAAANPEIVAVADAE
jgi:thymidine phosphorylase